MVDIITRIIPEEIDLGKRLGRHVEHDPRSKEYPYTVTLTPEFRRVHHRLWGGVLDQLRIGSCTGNATAGAINTGGLHIPRHKLLREPEAVDIYKLATSLDEFPGTYPPEDTGSSGLSAAKAALQMGYIGSYRHAFNMEEVLTALMDGPVITGVDWYEGFDTPDINGLVKIEGQIRGGHEFVVVGFEPAAKLENSVVVAQNSWNVTWGVKGRFRFTIATWQQLLDAQGDVTILLK